MDSEHFNSSTTTFSKGHKILLIKGSIKRSVRNWGAFYIKKALLEVICLTLPKFYQMVNSSIRHLYCHIFQLLFYRDCYDKNQLDQHTSKLLLIRVFPTLKIAITIHSTEQLSTLGIKSLYYSLLFLMEIMVNDKNTFEIHFEMCGRQSIFFFKWQIPKIHMLYWLNLLHCFQYLAHICH